MGDFIVINLKIKCTFVSMWGYVHVRVCAPGAGVSGSCEPPDVGAGKCELRFPGIAVHETLITKPSLQPHNEF